MNEQEGIITRNVDFAVQDEHGTWKTHTATVRIDLVSLGRTLGRRALRAKHGRAVLGSGMIRVVVPR
jgi:hypothetical protein